MTKKIIKLAVIRENGECPFGVSINWSCKHAGDLINNLMPLEKIGEYLNTNELTPEEIEKVKQANMRALVWNLMRNGEEPKECVYASNLFPGKDNKVDCSYGDTAAGSKPTGSLAAYPFYSQIFAGLDSIFGYPIGYYSDYNISRNLFHSYFSLQANEIYKEELKAMAEKAYEEAIALKPANKIG